MHLVRYINAEPRFVSAHALRADGEHGFRTYIDFSRAFYLFYLERKNLMSEIQWEEYLW